MNAALAISPFIPRALIDRAALSAAVAAVGRTAEKNSPSPVLTTVMLRASGDGLDVEATNLDRVVIVHVPGAVDAGFGALIPAQSFTKVLKSAKASDMVAIDCVDASSARLDFAGLNVTLNSPSVLADWPASLPFDDGAKVHAFTLDTADLAAVLAKVGVAVSEEETRYYLNGIYIHPVIGRNGEGNSLRFVATDGHRLAQYDVPLPLGAGEMPGVIIPRHSAVELAKLIGGRNAPATVSVRAATNRLEFTIGGAVMRTKTVDGTFPDYVKVVPRDVPFGARFVTADLAAAIRQVMVISSDRGRAVKFAFESEGECKLIVHNADLGSASFDVAVADFPAGAAGFECGFNADYLLDALGAVGDDVTLAFGDHEGRPFNGGPIRITSGAEPRYLYVLMPMRV